MSIIQKLTQTLAFLSVMVALAACGLNLARRPVFSSSPAITPTPTQQFTIGPSSAQSNLAQLASYRANLVIDFEGTFQGQPASGHLENLIEVSRQPASQHYYLTLEGKLPEAGIRPGVSEFFQIGETVYLKKAVSSAWSQFSQNNASFGSFDLFEPTRLIILPPTVSTPPRRENLNGLSVQRYRFSRADLADQANYIVEKAVGDLWVATPGDYVVQYVISASLRVAQPDPKAHLFDEGSMRLSYALTDINADFSINPPTLTATDNDMLKALPRPPDAEIITVLPTLIEYTSAISPVSATLFYRKILSNTDWVEDGTQIFNEKAQLIFSKDDQQLNVIIAPANVEGKKKVSLNLE